MIEPHPIEEKLKALITAEGPIPVARFMGIANAAYYASHDPFGVKGDFITAPEVSQMFGELIGLAFADAWKEVGKSKAHYIELGPGRGTLAVDALRAMASVHLQPSVHFVETSPVLCAAQKERVPHAQWHDRLSTLPDDGPLLIVANEFFDALPVEQYVKTIMGWRELMVRVEMDGFATVPGQVPCEDLIPESIRSAHVASVYERAPLAQQVLRALARRLANQGGLMVLIDYGEFGRAGGDTLQAVHAHAYADPFVRPGKSDLTAHVDFGAMVDAASVRGVRVRGPVEQGDWLVALGIDIRSDQLTRAHPERAAELAAARMRLIHPEQMGTLFKVVGLSGPHWPILPGLA